MKVIGLNDRALAEQIIGPIRRDGAEPLVIDYTHLGHEEGVATVYAWHGHSICEYRVEVDPNRITAYYCGSFK